MIETILAINIIGSFILIGYLLSKASDEKKELTKELTKALLSNNINEYVETISEDEWEEEEEQDELEDVDSVDEKILITHLNQEYEDFKNKN